MDQSLASFRDPEGSLFQVDGRIFRRVVAGAPVLAQEGPLAQCLAELQAQGHWIAAHPAPLDAWGILRDAGLLDAASEGDQLLEHPRIFFPSYPHEWCAGMLAAAGTHTLTVAEALLEAGFELKDGTPTNILFQGCHPLFIDHTSPVTRPAGTLGWRAYGQFSRNFVIPLLLHQRRAIPLAQTFLAKRDGVPPTQAAATLGLRRYLDRTALTHVALPALFARSGSASEAPSPRQSPYGEAVTRSILRGLRRTLVRLTPPAAPKSAWSRYQDAPSSYTSSEIALKDAAVRAALEAAQPCTVLDLGANTGRYAFMAAALGAQVVALDSDAASIDSLFQRAVQEGADILPLVADLARPSPALGWGNREQASLLSRAEGRFDLVMLLALVHHLLVTERIPLPTIVDLAARLTTNHAIIEWVAPSDDHFQKIAGPNLPLYQQLTLPVFEEALSARFIVVQRSSTKGEHRCLFLLRRIP